jgi:hypothetical protein
VYVPLSLVGCVLVTIRIQYHDRAIDIAAEYGELGIIMLLVRAGATVQASHITDETREEEEVWLFLCTLQKV